MFTGPRFNVFCIRIAGADFVGENDLAVAFFDGFPVSPGHCLIVPRRHESNFLGLTSDEWDLENRKAMKGAATKRVLDLIAQLEAEGLL